MSLLRIEWCSPENKALLNPVCLPGAFLKNPAHIRQQPQTWKLERFRKMGWASEWTVAAFCGSPSPFYSPRQKEMGTTQHFKSKAISIGTIWQPFSVSGNNVCWVGQRRGEKGWGGPFPAVLLAFVPLFWPGLHCLVLSLWWIGKQDRYLVKIGVISVPYLGNMTQGGFLGESRPSCGYRTTCN